MTRYHWASATATIATAVLCSTACQTGQAAPNEGQPSYQPTATIKDLMDSIVDPQADVVWDAVSTTVGSGGITDNAPTSDEEWDQVRHGAITLVEASNLLLVPGRHVARPGEKSETPGIELEPQEMEALITKDLQAWNQRVATFHEAALDILHAVEAHDSQRLFEVGDNLDVACEGCHRQYWYPNEEIPAFPEDTVASHPRS